jgi:hypothetical protein
VARSVLVAPAACAIAWDDGDGRRHALGLGHVSWSLPVAPAVLAVHGLDVIGVGLLATRSATGLVIGFGRERIVQLGDDQFIALDCLDCNLAESRPRGGTVAREAVP